MFLSKHVSVFRYEHFFGPLAAHNLCVTNAMKDDLQKNWGIEYDLLHTSRVIKHPTVRLCDPASCLRLKLIQSLFDVCRATTLYDRPPSIFRETPLKLQHELFMRLAKAYPHFQSDEWEMIHLFKLIIACYDTSAVSSDVHTLSRLTCCVFPGRRWRKMWRRWRGQFSHVVTSLMTR